MPGRPIGIYAAVPWIVSFVGGPLHGVVEMRDRLPYEIQASDFAAVGGALFAGDAIPDGPNEIPVCIYRVRDRDVGQRTAVFSCGRPGGVS